MVLVPFQALGFWGTLLFLIFLEPSWEQEQTYIISTPIVFRVGAPENVTVQAYGYTEAFDTTISVKSYPNKNVNYSSGTVELSPENKFQNSAILTDPEGSEVGIIGGRNGTGIASFPDFKIPSNPKLGRWTIKANYREDASTTGTTHFEVQGHEKAFKMAVMPTTDLQQKMEKQDKAHVTCHQTSDCLVQKINEQASKYKHPVIKKCCYDGARYNEHETCVQRAAHVTIGPNCVKAFSLCCEIAHQMTFKHIHMSSLHNRA
ncbi:complement C5-like isoform X2 [Rattus norvegicus]|uniref:hemolytic complement-like precursor n=1 Tax=Rattus norvegicus TaxID=10116 RepID=UPI00191703AF|nr:complement C5 isoform X2 [Rattus norvegicus]